VCRWLYLLIYVSVCVYVCRSMSTSFDLELTNMAWQPAWNIQNILRHDNLTKIKHAVKWETLNLVQRKCFVEGLGWTERDISGRRLLWGLLLIGCENHMQWWVTVVISDIHTSSCSLTTTYCGHVTLVKFMFRLENWKWLFLIHIS